VNGQPFFKTDAGLWTSSGIPAGTYETEQLIQSHDAASAPSDFTRVGDALYFVASDGVHGRELWRSDPRGTRMVLDIAPDGSFAAPDPLTELNGRLVFGADNGKGRQLWATDGTAAGTAVISSFTNFGSIPTQGPQVVRAGEFVYFGARDARGYELWRSDGTAAGTVLVRDINPGTASSSPWDLVAMGNALFFRADDGHGTELWRSDGTAKGTLRVADILPGEGGSGPDDLAVSGTTLFFNADDGTHGRELWRSDGTAAGTKMVSDINTSPTTTKDSIDFDEIVSLSPGRIIFTTHTDRGVYAVGASNGTLAGTIPLVAPSYQKPGSLIPAGGAVYFASDLYLWRTDGTLGGTKSLLFPDGGNLQELTAIGGRVFFAATQQGTGRELWMADSGGLRLVADFNPGSNSSSPSSLTAIDDTLFFAADDGFHASEPWALAVPPVGTVSGSVFIDANGDGSRTDDKTAPGYRVFLDANDDGAWQAGEIQVRTDDKGWFVLPDVPAGKYWLRTTPVGGWRYTTPDAFRVTVTSGGIVIRHFGVTRNILVTGTVFMDANRSGAMDPAESGLSAWRVFVDADGDGVLDDDEYSVLTDAEGRYSIGVLAGGTYQVRVVGNVNYRPTTPAGGYVGRGAARSDGGGRRLRSEAHRLSFLGAPRARDVRVSRRTTLQHELRASPSGNQRTVQQLRERLRSKRDLTHRHSAGRKGCARCDERGTGRRGGLAVGQSGALSVADERDVVAEDVAAGVDVAEDRVDAVARRGPLRVARQRDVVAEDVTAAVDVPGQDVEAEAEIPAGRAVAAGEAVGPAGGGRGGVGPLAVERVAAVVGDQRVVHEQQQLVRTKRAAGQRERGGEGRRVVGERAGVLADVHAEDVDGERVERDVLAEAHADLVQFTQGSSSA
jgi:ELWxxDGT repeat protein